MPKITIKKIDRAPDSAVVLILQWLTYALWGLFVGALMWLAGVLFAAAFVKSASPVPGDLLAFTIASTLVLLLLAVVADTWYSRHEPAEKTGAAKVIMLVHTVLFALLGVGLVVTLVYNLIAGAVSPEDTEGVRMAVVLTTLTGAVGLKLLLARILMPFKKPWLRTAFMVIMAVLGVGFIIAAFTGPATEARLAAEDTVVEDGVELTAVAINQYANENDKLPASLSDIKLDETNNYSGYAARLNNAKKALDKNLIRYTADTKAPAEGGGIYPLNKEQSAASTATVAPYPAPDATRVFYYKLCVTYKTDQSKRDNGYKIAPASDTEVSVVTPYTYGHGKGEKCYDLQTQYTYTY